MQLDCSTQTRQTPPHVICCQVYTILYHVCVLFTHWYQFLWNMESFTIKIQVHILQYIEDGIVESVRTWYNLDQTRSTHQD